MIEKLNKKSLQYLGIIIIIAIIVSTGLIYYLKKTELKKAPEQKKPAEKTMEEIIESLSVPASEEEVEPIPEEVLDSLTAPE